jgi:hypothetical protein
MATSDYCAFVPFVNRPDLLRNVLVAVSPLWDDLTVIDNSGHEIIVKPDAVKVFRPPVPLLFTQTMNWEFEETIRNGKPFCVHMHNDAIIPEGACEKLLDFAREIDRTEPHWGACFTLYDIFAVFNPKLYQDIGGYDTNFAAYVSDQDWFRRMDLAGWTRHQAPIEIGHVGSQTIRSDPYLAYVNNITHPLYREYYRQKWGGCVGEEQFIYPFGVRPKMWKLQ